MIFEEEHWKIISRMVSEKCLIIFPHIKSKKLKSEIISNLFETQSERYFNSIGIKTLSSKSDKDPDLFFIDYQKPCEIKVTGVEYSKIDKCKWMGGKYSKRTSDYIFVIWNYEETHSTLYGEKPECFNFLIAKCFVDETEWNTIDSGNENYYATVFDSKKLLEREHVFLVGNHNSEKFVLSEFK